MSKHVVRRRTLNAGEIEEFLSELNNNNNENHNPNVVNNNYVNDNKNITINKSDNIDNDDSMENMIRKFSKLSYSPNNVYFHTSPNDYTCDIARNIHTTTGYKLLPSRTVYPEQFSLPPSSLESKKSLVVSLSSMISGGEKQRLHDAGECEAYTRCRVEKNRIRNGNYEYYDIDINAIISIPDYESRYCAFIESKKVKPSNQSSSDHIPNDPIEIIVDCAASSEPSPSLTCLQQEVPPPPPPLSPLSNSSITLTTLASTTILSSSQLTSTDDKVTHDSTELTVKINSLCDNLASELDAILANADGDDINSARTKDRKKRSKMRRSIISMDYLQDLSLMDDDDNDDRKLIWKSHDSVNTDGDAIVSDPVESSIDSTIFSDVNDKTENIINEDNNEFCKEIVETIECSHIVCVDATVDATIDATVDVNVDATVIVSVDANLDTNVDASIDTNVGADDVMNSATDDFTYEVIIPTHDHDEDDIEKDLVVPVEEIMEPVTAIDNNSIADDSVFDTNDIHIIEATTTFTSTTDIYDSCISIGNDMKKNIDICNDNNVDVEINVDNSSDIINTECDKITVENNDNNIEIVADSTNMIDEDLKNTLDNECCKETVETIETKAFVRLNIRFEQARWKYQWELVSYYAALHARNRLQMNIVN